MSGDTTGIDLDALSIEQLEEHRETLRLARKALTGRGAYRRDHPGYNQYQEVAHGILYVDVELGRKRAAGAPMPDDASLTAALQVAQAARGSR